MEKTIDVVTARQRFGQMIEEAHSRGHVFIIERAGRPMVAVVPLEQYCQWQMRHEQFFAWTEQVRERTRQVPPEELEATIDEAVQAAKQADRPTSAGSLSTNKPTN